MAYNPENLVSSTVDNSLSMLFENPDEAPLLDHPDVVSFEGPSLDEPLDLAGPIDLHVRVASTAPTTDLYIKLCDQSPDGRLRQIARSQAMLERPDADCLHRIELSHIGYRMGSGHRLTLLIASSDCPEFPPNSRTAENRWTAVERRPSQQTLRTEPGEPCRLALTVMPPDA